MLVGVGWGLFELYAAGWVDMAYNVAWYDEGGYADDGCGDVDGGYLCPWEGYGDVAEIVADGVEGDKFGVVLEGEEEECCDVAYHETAQYNHGGEAEEDVTELGVGGSHGFHDADEGGALEDDDEQAADHGDDGYEGHEYEYGYEIGRAHV